MGFVSIQKNKMSDEESGSQSDSSEGLEVEEKEEEEENEDNVKEEEKIEDEADDLSWSSSDDEGEEIVISTVTAEVCPLSFSSLL